MTPVALPVGTRVVVGAFTASGVTHMVAPQVFEPLIPRSLGSPRAWVYASGAAELVCAAGLVTRQRWAPAATVGVLAGIWVGNWSMALAWQRSERRPAWQKAAAWGRLPAQLPLMWWAWTSPTGGGIRRGPGAARKLSP